MDWQSVLKSIAPTVATALLGPLGGVAVSAIGNVLGLDKATTSSIKDAITSGQMTPEQISKLKELELEYQNNEKERDFRYADLAFQDRDSARKANVAGNVQRPLFWLSILLLVATLGSEGYTLFQGVAPAVPDMVVGRILGLMDAVALLVLNYWFGTSAGSAQKTELLTQKATNGN